MIARDEARTKTYNHFHDRAETSEGTQRLRELHLAERFVPVFLPVPWERLAADLDAY
jgi:hypothetical protein